MAVCNQLPSVTMCVLVKSLLILQHLWTNVLRQQHLLRKEKRLFKLRHKGCY